ncbi:MAG: sodium-independent anion transporter [Hyphomicrobiales bacterium]|nr:MAG: sodium-independent anion transporter [Hyphomicrobiales bacterium]
MTFPFERVFPFLSWLPRVNRETLRADAFAGLTGAVIVLPQGVAFATIAGLPPQYGLYTAMVTPVIAALFGSSLHLISGPTTAISIVVFSAVSRYATVGTPEFVSMALTLTLLAGLYQLVLGLARMGALVNFVSHTVVVGFTAGAGILIATSQMKNVLGINLPKGESFIHTWRDLWLHIGEMNLYILLVSASTLVIAILIKKFVPKLPNLLIAMIIAGLIALGINGAQHGMTFVGEIPAQLPPFSIPDLAFPTLKTLARDAFAIALLGLIEAVSISRAIAAKSHQRIDGNQEFIGQGLSNIVGSFFSSYAGSGSFTRSGINYSSGAQTPMSALFAAAFLVLIVLLVAPLMAYLPVAAMAGVILLVAYNLIDFHQIKHVLESSYSETAILLTTLFATLLLELEFAIYLGVLLSLVIFLMRTSTPEIVTLAPDIDPVYHKKTLTDVQVKPLLQCPDMRILRIDMSIYFGSVNHIQSKLQHIIEKERIYHILLIGEGINAIDLSGTEMLMQEAERLDELGGGLYFTGLKPQVYQSISRTHMIKEIGNNHFFDDKNEAITTLRRLLRFQKRCENCTVKAFADCREEAA